MWKAPYRANNKITQPFNDGIAEFYSVTNTAPPGYEPTEGLVLKRSLRFEEQRLGINRLYLSRQNQSEISMVIRVPYDEEVSNQDVAVINGGRQYRVDTTQLVPDIWPKSMDVALSAIEQKYEVPKNE